MARRFRRAIAGPIALTTALGLLVSLGPAAVEGSITQTAGHPAWRCKRPTHGFIPSKAQLPALGRTVKVIQVNRTSNGAIGAGPVTQSGKWMMAMDPKTHPGSHQGSVILSGHTWPDGSALGNAMLKNLWTGNGIVLIGDDGKKACYRINRRKSYPEHEVPGSVAFRSTGPEQAVIVTCSGKRLGPGHWTRRTIWYATPWTPAPPPPPPSDPPPADQPSNGSLLGGLFGSL